MRRLLRWAFSGSCLLSLLVLTGASVLWVRNLSPRDDHLQVSVGGRLVDLSLYGGGLSLEVVGEWPGPAGVWLTCAAGGDEKAERYRFVLDGNRPGTSWLWLDFHVDRGFFIPNRSEG